MTDLPRRANPGRAVERTVEDFDQSYLGTPAWDIGRPQPLFAALFEEGAISGRVLDAGCGTGEHALMVAARGLDATGIDVSRNAIEIAMEKATERGIAAVPRLGRIGVGRSPRTVRHRAGQRPLSCTGRRASGPIRHLPRGRPGTPRAGSCLRASANASPVTGDPAASDKPNCEMSSHTAGSSNRSNQCGSTPTSSHP